MMDVIEALQKRRSTRAYLDKPVDRAILLKIMEAAKQTPSWANSQPWEVFVGCGEPLERMRRRYTEKFQQGAAPAPEFSFPQGWPEAHQKRIGQLGAGRLAALGIDRDDKEARAKMTANNYRFFGAPAVIYLCMDRNLTRWSLYDLGAFSQSVMLAAESFGLNTIPAIILAAFPEVIREELKVPADLAIVMGIALGYGDPDSIHNQYVTERRPADEFVRIEGA